MTATSPDTSALIPWADRDDRHHPPEPHRCECSCHETLDPSCPEHGWQVRDLERGRDSVDAEGRPRP